jgi:pteridine reductase
MTEKGTGKPVAVITGAAKRVGLAIATVFAKAGFDLVVTYRSSREHAHESAAELRKLGANVRLEQLDLDRLGDVIERGLRLAKELRRVDVLVHNASVYTPTPLKDLVPEDVLTHLRINAAAPLLLSKHLAVRLAESPLPAGGAIVAMCDMHAMGRPRKDLSAYLMSKAALIEMVRSLARELAPKVRVNGVAPGVVAFPERGAEADAEMQKQYLSRVPMQRSGTPEDAAEVVRWLALDAKYTTGEIVRVDGGRWLA